ncbi:hypothetical protein ACTJJ0_30170 [Chitinophaga sp. 22321]|uniref:ABC-2 type transport system permease protein n=1 Tax=Chitinophaga hostae TaxID=2831022 RepID=A0ABS5J8C9_9BACT|nr:hypothetical protein [Chitinophaga hostae]MBS0031356.1 hypothetical protein [Chitinophaga hostae]
MKLFTFLLKKRTAAYFSLSGNWKEQLGDLLLAVLLLVSAVALAVLHNYAIQHPAGKFDAALLFHAVKLTVLVSPLILKLFPSFSMKRTFIGAEYPLSKNMVAALDLLALSLYRTRYAIYVLYIAVYACIASHVNSADVLSLFLLLATGILSAENIINAVSWRKYFYLLLVLLAAAGQYLITAARYSAAWNLPLSVLVVILNVTLYFFYYERSYESSAGDERASSATSSAGQPVSRNLHWVLVLRNRAVVTVLLIGIGFKLLIVSNFLFLKGGNLYMVMDKVPFILCLIIPIILFSYVYNNIWGYFYSVALNNLIIQASPQRYVKMYLELLFPALITDIVLTFVCLGIAHMIEWKIAATYLVFAFFSITIGIISSFSKYFPVPAAFDFNRFRAKTSRRYTLAQLLPAMAAGFLYNMPLYLYVLLGIILLAGIGLWIYISRNLYDFSLRLKKDFFNA